MFSLGSFYSYFWFPVPEALIKGYESLKKSYPSNVCSTSLMEINPSIEGRVYTSMESLED